MYMLLRIRMEHYLNPCSNGVQSNFVLYVHDILIIAILFRQHGLIPFNFFPTLLYSHFIY